MGIIEHFQDNKEFQKENKKTLEINDIIKKRTKGKFLTDIKTKDLYNYYMESITPIESIKGGKTRGKYDITQQEYSAIIKDINLAIVKLVILENFEFKIPCNLGTFSVRQAPVRYKLKEDGELNTKILTADFKATRELWLKNEEARKAKKLIFHTNEHTNGNRMTYWWSKKGAKASGIAVYYFQACRQVKRLLKDYIMDKDLGLNFYCKY